MAGSSPHEDMSNFIGFRWTAPGFCRDDFHISAQGSNEGHQPVDRKPPKSPIQQSRDFGLVDAEGLSRFSLRHLPLLDDVGNLADETGLRCVGLRIPMVQV